MDKLKTSHEWIKDMPKGIRILDPDGWDRKDFENSMNELISEDEFNKRLSWSTCEFKTN